MKSSDNAYSSCHTCNIKDECWQQTQDSYYVLHTNYNFQNSSICKNLHHVIDLVEQAQQNIFNCDFDITHSSILLCLHSLHFSRSFLADIMHCVLQNITPD